MSTDSERSRNPAGEVERVHKLKTWPRYYSALVDGSKTFEVRRDDRRFREGDILLLREWLPNVERYTGRECARVVTYCLRGPGLGVETGFVVMAIRYIGCGWCRER